MTDEIEIVLLGAPRGKERPRFVRETGRAYTPKRTAEYEGALKVAARDAMGDRPPMEGPLEVHLRIIVPVAASWSKKRRAAALAWEEMPTKKPDLDNTLKGFLDALNLIVYVDDTQVVDSTISKRYGEKPGLWGTIRRANMGAFA